MKDRNKHMLCIEQIVFHDFVFGWSSEEVTVMNYSSA